jgi:hypothetical protein
MKATREGLILLGYWSHKKKKKILKDFVSCHTVNTLCLGSEKELVNVQGNNCWWF